MGGGGGVDSLRWNIDSDSEPLASLWLCGRRGRCQLAVVRGLQGSEAVDENGALERWAQLQAQARQEDNENGPTPD